MHLPCLPVREVLRVPRFPWGKRITGLQKRSLGTAFLFLLSWQLYWPLFSLFLPHRCWPFSVQVVRHFLMPLPIPASTSLEVFLYWSLWEWTRSLQHRDLQRSVCSPPLLVQWSILSLDLGVRGAALATVLSQAVGAVWILRFLTWKKTILHLRKENFRLRRDIILPCLALGISTFVMLSTESILSISFTSSLSRYGGDLAVGAMTIITSVSQLVTMPVQGICQGGQLITSYNFGTNNKKRVKEAFLPSLKPASFLRPCAGLFCFLHACENWSYWSLSSLSCRSFYLIRYLQFSLQNQSVISWRLPLQP